MGSISAIIDELSRTYKGEPRWNEREISAHRTKLRDGYYSGKVAGKLNPSDVVDTVQEAMPRDTIATTDVGSHKLLVGQGWAAYEPLTLLMTNGLSSMGFALPAAITAKLLNPDRPVVCFSGDGGLAMVQSELHLAVIATSWNCRGRVLRQQPQPDRAETDGPQLSELGNAP